MGYQSQLVVRTRDPREGQLIERIKELAAEKGKTYSEMALELLARGLGDASAPSAPQPEATVDADNAGMAARQRRSVDTPAAEPVVETVEVQERITAATPTSTTPSEPMPVEPMPEEASDFDLDVDYDTSVDFDGADGPQEVAEKAATCLDEAGVAAAVQLLARFFVGAGPVEGGQVRNALKDRLNRSDFAAIQDALNEAPPYRQYRQRVIYGH